MNHFVFTVVFFAVFVTSSSAGMLAMLDRSALLTDNVRRKHVSFMNVGSDTARYTIRFTERIMHSDGSFSTVSIDSVPETHRPASPYLRIYPRSIVVPPRERQAVIIQYRRSSDMAEGEYRSHLLFTPEPVSESRIEESQEEREGLGTQINTVVSVSIPVRIHVGTPSSRSSIENGYVQPDSSGSPSLVVDLERTGNREFVGSLLLEHLPQDGSDPVRVGREAVLIYHELSQRTYEIPLDETLSTGTLRLRLLEEDAAEDSPLAEHFIEL
ncbi:hypothetical protein [Chitinivibrio alkaliphilus]|uniref:Pili assembly chaperone N-terminal domain-containing protein n=1 Tax=Chitinivibrio alkaliphilus ACht1 TaxID=1313304 RepID=U7DAU4_9BACT|nr:hypothetical protein [Chitinivibrio alkaliphilus]ERP38693.1 hypothetical protein CALK_0710 [Chitinivibrio alkaliphilus ACht1]